MDEELLNQVMSLPTDEKQKLIVVLQNNIRASVHLKEKFEEQVLEILEDMKE